MIYAIADLHLDSSGEKPMDIFGENWIGHDKKIFDSWNKNIKEDDLVLLPGDISWGLKLEDARRYLEIIDSLPGTKIITKGNHDYWWSSMSKLNALQLKKTIFLNNTSYEYKGIGICGTRGWMDKSSSEYKSDMENIYSREMGRLRNSIESSKAERKIVLLHYPPFDGNKNLNDFGKIALEYKAEVLLYGHLHGEGHREVVEGNFDGMEVICVSSDFINFEVKKIWD